MHNRHAWIIRTDEGLKREVRVIKTGGSWRFQSKRADEDRWTYYDEPLMADLEEFREISVSEIPAAPSCLRRRFVGRPRTGTKAPELTAFAALGRINKRLQAVFAERLVEEAPSSRF